MYTLPTTYFPMQIRSFPALQPARALRDTGIRSVVLMDGQIDHTTGLLMLREGKPLELRAACDEARASGSVQVAGDVALGDRILDGMAFTP